MLFDTHAHITSDALFPEADSIIQRAMDCGLVGIINICSDTKSLHRGLDLAKRYERVFIAGATHPHEVKERGESEFEIFKDVALSGKLVAIGETGLDYYYSRSPSDIQLFYLEKYLALAQEAKLPVVIHCRGTGAFANICSVIHDEMARTGILIHCFTGSAEEAETILARGWWISISGIVTFKKSDGLRAVVRDFPIERLLLETDSPFLTPESNRGSINEPRNVQEIAEVIAGIKGMQFSQLAEVTYKNAEKFFKLDRYTSGRYSG